AVVALEIVTATPHLHADHFAERVAGDEFTLRGQDRIQRGKGRSGGSHRVFGVEGPGRDGPGASLASLLSYRSCRRAALPSRMVRSAASSARIRRSGRWK